MNIYRVRHLETREVAHAVEQDGGFRRLDETINSLMDVVEAGRPAAIGASLGTRDDVRLLAPVRPTKVVCIGLNYQHHADEMDKSIPDEPLMFLKPPSAVIGPGQAIELPPQSSEVHHEGELAVVIGRKTRQIAAEDVSAHILGYTCANDVTARDIQRREQRYTRGKGFDTFCPLGPNIATADDFQPAEHVLSCRVDGEQKQTSTLDDFIFDIPYVVSFVSHVMTLLPGDVILTGTPMGVGPIVQGNVVEVDVDGIGVLRNRVEARR
jgi:2-keto-4-pentenoate hydratase/2-oxohepta-3-ene-1,7-dioic acid hydratase in catechol pathway